MAHREGTGSETHQTKTGDTKMTNRQIINAFAATLADADHPNQPALKAACKAADAEFGRFAGETLYDVRRMAVNEQFGS
jgi:hypothetical protein